MRIGRRHRGAGFTLLEVLVALAIIAIALTALIKGLAMNAANTAYLRDRTFTQWVAMNVVAEERLKNDASASKQASGSERLGGHEWFWRYRLADTLDAGIKRMEVEVRAEEDGDAPVITRLVAFLPAAPQGKAL